MSKDSIDKLIDAVKLLGLVGLAILAYYLGAHELGLMLGGGALGHAVPTVRRSAPAAVVLLAVSAATLSTGCTAADQLAMKGALGDVLGVVRKVCTGVSMVDRVAGPMLETSGGEEDEEPHTIDGEDPADEP